MSSIIRYIIRPIFARGTPSPFRRSDGGGLLTSKFFLKFFIFHLLVILISLNIIMPTRKIFSENIFLFFLNLNISSRYLDKTTRYLSYKIQNKIISSE